MYGVTGFSVMPNEAPDPIHVHLFGAQTVMFETQNPANFIQQFGLGRFVFVGQNVVHGFRFGHPFQRKQPYYAKQSGHGSLGKTKGSFAYFLRRHSSVIKKKKQKEPTKHKPQT